MTPSRGLAAALLGAAALASRPAPAAADYPDHADGTIAPWKKWTRGLFFAGHGGSIAGIDEGGFGLDLELARGHGRWQFFGDSLIEWTALSVVPAPLAGATGPGAAAGTAAAGATTTTPPAGTAGTDGFDVRLGFGARRVLRAVEPDSSAAIELYVEGGGGVTRTWWNGGGTLTRPDLSVGAGWQIRGFQAPLLAIRLAVKVIVQPPIDDAATASLCHGTCPPAGHHGGDTAFIGQFGVSW